MLLINDFLRLDYSGFINRRYTNERNGIRCMDVFDIDTRKYAHRIGGSN